MKHLLILLLLVTGVASGEEPKVTPKLKALQCAFSMETNVMSRGLLRTQEDVDSLLESRAETDACSNGALKVLPKGGVRDKFASLVERFNLVMSDSDREYVVAFKLALADFRAAARQ